MTAWTDKRTTARLLRGKWLRIFLAVALLTPILAFQVPPPTARGDDLSDAVAQQQKLNQIIADQKKQLAQLTAMQSSLQTQINATKTSLASVSQTLDQTQKQVDALQTDIDAVKAKYDGLIAQVTQLGVQLKEIEAQEAAKQTELEQRQGVLAQRLVAAYQTDQTSLLEQLLSGRSLTDVLSDVTYYMDMGAADKALAVQIEADQKTLVQLHQNVLDTRSATQQLADEAATQKKQLDTQMAQLSAEKAQLAKLKLQTQQQLAAQKAAEARLAQNQSALAATIKSNSEAQSALAKKIDQLAAAAAARNQIPSGGNGMLAWPMGGTISQPYGCTGFIGEPPLGNCAHFHEGIDIVAPCYTPVHASAAGEVLFVGYNPYDAPPQAWIVILVHAGGVQTWYAHMQAKAPAGIHAGATVSRGQVVGWEYTTGHSTGCHLHWAVRVGGSFVNPNRYL